MGRDGKGERAGVDVVGKEGRGGSKGVGLHQSDSDFKDIVAEREIREIVPGVLGPGFEVGGEEGLLGVFEAGHCCCCCCCCSSWLGLYREVGLETVSYLYSMQREDQ